VFGEWQLPSVFGEWQWPSVSQYPERNVPYKLNATTGRDTLRRPYCNTLQLTALQEAEKQTGFDTVHKTGGLVVLCRLEFHFTGAN